VSPVNAGQELARSEILEIKLSSAVILTRENALEEFGIDLRRRQ